MNIQWFPGHMTKTRRQIEEKLKLIDVVVEILDARIPLSSKNPDITELTKGKPRIVVLNKSDLADEVITKKWVEYYKNAGIMCCVADSEKGKGVAESINLVKQVMAEKIAKDSDKGMNRAIKILVAGVPNAGKSSYINRLAGRASATVGDRPGVTRGQQWIRLKNGIELLDTPGILWPKFEDERVGEHLAFTGAVKDEIMDIELLACKLAELLNENYRELLCARYKLENTDGMQGYELVEYIGKKRGFVISGGEIDFLRASNILLDEFRSAKIGRISIETPEEA
ncbi:MAG: ribosome biogenesis GTPase YlqF [Clostridia bacterium]|nr:ribosome biogenesis GTPase YlqF [Clostridia bacterium]